MRIVTGIVEITGGLFCLYFFSSDVQRYWHYYVEYPLLPQLIDQDTVVMVSTLIIGVILLVAGTFVIRRRHWRFALTASILFFLVTAMWWFAWAEGIYLHPFIFAGLTLSMLSIVLTVISRKEFKTSNERMKST